MREYSPSNILISIPNWVGDAVMATAALRAIRRQFPKARIVHLMRPYVAAVLEGTPFADETCLWPTSRGAIRGLLDDVRFGLGLRPREFDLAVLMTNSFRSALVAWLGRAARRVGYARDGRRLLLTDSLKPPRANGHYVPIPALDYYNRLAMHVGCRSVDDRLELATSAANEAAIDERLGNNGDFSPGGSAPRRPLVVLNPGANFGIAKCWPAENYAAVADALAERHGARVIASLAPGEADIAHRLCSAAKRPLEVCIDPPLGLGPLKALIRRADLLITNDTGPRHFAAAFNVPVITVFGSSDPAWTLTRFAKERTVKLELPCQPCMKRVCPLKHHHCMTQLEPAAVLSVAEDVLQKFAYSAATP